MPFGGDAVSFEWNGTGTGNVTAGNALPRRRLPPASDNGKTLTYRIDHTSQDQAETGRGTWSSATSTLTRVSVITSRNAGVIGGPGSAFINFTSGLKIVAWVASSEDLDDIDLITEVLAFTPSNYTPV